MYTADGDAHVYSTLSYKCNSKSSLHLVNPYCVPGTVLGNLHGLSHLIFPITL